VELAAAAVGVRATTLIDLLTEEELSPETVLEKPRLRASARSADAERSAPVGDGAFVSPNIAIQESCREESISTQDQQAIIECVESRPLGLFK
jgi:hypothetical protein